MKKSIVILGFISSILLTISISLIFLTYILTKNAVLDHTKLIKTTQTIEIYSNNGNLIDKKSSGLGGEYIKLNSLNDYTKNAFIAVEDKRFYSHNGIDIKRIIGASLNNLKSMSFKEGASTITQQLIKNTHLSNEKTVKRKLQEIKLAVQLENNYSKDEILELYLNTIYFGKGAYGIEEASKTYFNKSASNLTICESAMLAGIIKSPSTYSPHNNYELANKRKNLILTLMNDCGFISDSEYKLNSLKNVSLKQSKSNYYSDYVNATLSELENSNIFFPYDNVSIKVHTYLDESLQTDISSKCTQYNESKIVINSKINGVTAFYGDNSNIKRSPASCVKPWLVYAPMLNDGYIKESSIVIDEKVDFNGYSPKNFNGQFHGAVTVKEALSNSLNVPAVKLLNGYGIKNANNYTKKMGLDIDNESLPCALGGLKNGISLKDLCDKYSVFNHDGNYVNSSFIKSVYFDKIKIYEHSPKPINVFSKETAFIVNDILKSAVQDGTSKKLRSLPYEVCAKTGTNGNESGNLDALSIAYTTDSIVGVWVGNYDNKVMPNTVTGSNQPTQISYNILQNIYKNHKPQPFLKPNGIIEAKIDKNELINNNKELLSSSGESFYYILGSEPSEYFLPTQKPKVENVKISIKNGTVTILYTSKNVENMKIYRNFKNKIECIYSGLPTDKHIDTLSNFGKYSYYIIASNQNEEIKYELPPVKFEKQNLTIFDNEKWLYQ